MSRYLVFYGQGRGRHQGLGGWRDYRGKFSSRELAKDFIIDGFRVDEDSEKGTQFQYPKFEWWQIVDLHRNEIIEQGFE